MGVAIDIDGGTGEAPPPRRRTRAVRSPVRRRPATRRPGGRPLAHRTGGATFSRAAHGRPAPRAGGGVLVIAALATALAIVGFACLGAGSVDGAVPTRTVVVQVRSGESLGDIAARTAPGAVVEQVVARIVEMNALAGSGVHPGQSLVVPVPAAG